MLGTEYSLPGQLNISDPGTEFAQHYIVLTLGWSVAAPSSCFSMAFRLSQSLFVQFRRGATRIAL